MNILVSGGKGFIGHNLVRELKNKHNVTVIDRNKNKTFEESGVKYINLDLTNFKKIKPFFEGIDIIFHMAAEISIEDSISNPLKIFKNNYISTLNILEMCRIFNVKKLVFSSTAALYKDTALKSSEDDIVHAINPYAASKLACEILCRNYANTYNLETVILRYFNVFGENPRNKKYKSVLPSFIERIKEKKPLLIYGSGNQTRDFVHVQDVVQANISAMTFEDKLYGEVFNIGSGKAHSIKQIAETLSREICFYPARDGEIQFSCANIKKIKTKLKWKPSTDIIKWLKQNYV
jgi:UDP-glucose 4-epimerase